MTNPQPELTLGRANSVSGVIREAGHKLLQSSYGPDHSRFSEPLPDRRQLTHSGGQLSPVVTREERLHRRSANRCLIFFACPDTPRELREGSARESSRLGLHLLSGASALQCDLPSHCIGLGRRHAVWSWCLLVDDRRAS
jgi:hypothetical protein